MTDRALIHIPSPQDMPTAHVLDASCGGSGHIWNDKQWVMNGIADWYSTTSAENDAAHAEAGGIGIALDADIDSASPDLKLGPHDARWPNSTPPRPWSQDDNIVMHIRFYVHSGGGFTGSTSNLFLATDQGGTANQGMRAFRTDHAFAYSSYEAARQNVQSGWRVLSIPLKNCTVTGKSPMQLAEDGLQYLWLHLHSSTVGRVTLSKIWFTKDLLNTHAASRGGGVMIFMDDCIDGADGTQMGEFLQYCQIAADRGVKLILPWIDWGQTYGASQYTTCSIEDMLAAIEMGHEPIVHNGDAFDDLGNDYDWYVNHFQTRQAAMLAWGDANGVDLSHNVGHYLCAGNYLNFDAVAAGRTELSTMWSLIPFAPKAGVGNGGDEMNCGLTLPIDPMACYRLNHGFVTPWLQYELDRMDKIVGEDNHIFPLMYHRISNSGDANVSLSVDDFTAVCDHIASQGYRTLGCTDFAQEAAALSAEGCCRLYTGESPGEIDWSDPQGIAPLGSTPVHLNVPIEEDDRLCVGVRCISAEGVEEHSTHIVADVRTNASGAIMPVRPTRPNELTALWNENGTLDLSFHLTCNPSETMPEVLDVLSDYGSGPIDTLTPISTVPLAEAARSTVRSGDHSASCRIRLSVASACMLAVRSRSGEAVSKPSESVPVVPPRNPATPRSL